MAANGLDTEVLLVARAHVLDLEHVDQLVQLLGRLLDPHRVAVERDRHPAHLLTVDPPSTKRFVRPGCAPASAR